MNKINLCLDIDSTVTQPDYWVDYANKYFNTNYVYDENTVAEFFANNGWNQKVFHNFYINFAPQMHRSAEIRPYAREAINKLKDFCNVYYVTARDSEVEHITIEWLKKYDIYSEVFHTGSILKNDIAKKLNCHIFVDDNLFTAKKLLDDFIRVLLFDTGFNRHEHPENIYRVYDWKEVYAHVLNFFEEQTYK